MVVFSHSYVTVNISTYHIYDVHNGLRPYDDNNIEYLVYKS